MDKPRLNIFYKLIGKRSKGIYFYIVVALIFLLFNNSCYKKVEGDTKTDDTSFVTLDSEIEYKIISDVAYRIIGQKQHPIEGIELREYRSRRSARHQISLVVLGDMVYHILCGMRYI